MMGMRFPQLRTFLPMAITEARIDSHARQLGVHYTVERGCLGFDNAWCYFETANPDDVIGPFVSSDAAIAAIRKEASDEDDLPPRIVVNDD